MTAVDSTTVVGSALGGFAEPAAAAEHFARRLTHETDPSDVAAALEAGERFHFIDVRSREAWDQGHAAAATHVPRGELAGRLAELDASIPIVVYCWGPACNGGTKAAHLLASLGRPVKEMLGGFEYWAREGLPVEGAGGPIHRAADPLTAPVVGGAAISCDC
ncbi:rhodanese-like domain-containing protein [Microcella alkaliphila]|uniref:Rhodanese-related sulfurtransferase n=1 Tax=Microcella alkaliphila TaxID=279828 RepID=A0A0U5BH84_9MICO|nr:rhodanese-like domain-containing protein [Microcella alkaliphila]BAU30885.1 rhodanese-related sulfurtransferase [Microcella alkaliphila]